MNSIRPTLGTNLFSRIATVISIQIEEKRALEFVIQLAAFFRLFLRNNLPTVLRYEVALLYRVLK